MADEQVQTIAETELPAPGLLRPPKRSEQVPAIAESPRPWPRRPARRFRIVQELLEPVDALTLPLAESCDRRSLLASSDNVQPSGASAPGWS